MPDFPRVAPDFIRDTAPKLADLTDELLFGDIWEREGLSKRDRSLLTVAVLMATGRDKQLEGHLNRALANGVTEEELVEAITHVTFYAGWPAGMTATQLLTGIRESRSDASSDASS